jgi:regulator of protease activity HflC (stomatin/prohibitin superfamily)
MARELLRKEAVVKQVRPPSATPPRIALAAVAVLFSTVALVILIQFFMGWRATPVDMIGLHYTGGPIDGQQFVKIIEPGSGNRFLGLQDQLALLPVTQRDYTASDDDGADGPPIVAPARGGVDMKFDVGAYFTLNTNADVARRFYERVCIKFECDSDEGWNAMLKVNFRRPIEQAIQQSIRDYTVNELYAGVPEAGAATDEEATAILERVQDQISADLKENINTVLGGDFFCGPTFDRSVDECPDFEFQITSATPISDAVRNAFNDNAASQQAVVTARNNAESALAVAEGNRAAQEAVQASLTPEYLRLREIEAMARCADNPNCTVVFTDGSTGVNVQTGTSGGG